MSIFGRERSPVVGLLIVVRTPANLQTSKKLEYDWLPTSRTPGRGKPFSTDKRKKERAVSSTQSNQRLNKDLRWACFANRNGCRHRTQYCQARYACYAENVPECFPDYINASSLQLLQCNIIIIVIRNICCDVI